MRDPYDSFFQEGRFRPIITLASEIVEPARQGDNIELLKPYFDALAALANFSTIATSGLALYLFVANRKNLSLVLATLLSYSFQTTLSELKEKLERLNEYNANEPSERSEIRNILQEIAGQIRGNDRLLASAPNLATEVETLALAKKLTEPAKRAMVSKLREQVRNIQINSVNRAMESKL